MPVSDTYPRQWIMMPKETYLAHPANDLCPCPTSSSCQVVSPGRLLFLLTWGSLLARNTFAGSPSSAQAQQRHHQKTNDTVAFSSPFHVDWKPAFWSSIHTNHSFPSRCGLVFEFCVSWSCQDPKVGLKKSSKIWQFREFNCPRQSPVSVHREFVRPSSSSVHVWMSQKMIN